MEILALPLVRVNTVWYGAAMDDRLNAQHWLDAGLDQLAVHGPDGLRIMAIADKLGVTKGSFYWHFRDLNEYRAALLEEWERGHTQQIIDHVEKTGGDAAAKLRNLMIVTVTADARLAQAIRSWGHNDALAGKAVKRVDKKRLAYLSGLIHGLGWPQDDAETLAHWSYCALLGHFALHSPVLTQQQIDLLLSTLAWRPSRAHARRAD